MDQSWSRRSSRALGLVVAALLALLPATATAAPSPRPKDTPRLSIAVDDGQTSAAAGDTLSYAVTVTTWVPTTSPASGSPRPCRAARPWSRRTRTGTSAMVRCTGRSSSRPPRKRRCGPRSSSGSPDSELRLATVACAAVSAKAPPLVCASDSNLLPAGEAAQTAEAEQQPGSAEVRWWYVPAGLAVLALLTVGILAVVRLRRTPEACDQDLSSGGPYPVKARTRPVHAE